jgi:hypothetical protein
LIVAIAQSPNRALDQSGQFVCGAVDGLVHGRGLVSDSYGLMTLKTGFQHTALVVRAALVAILVSQMAFNPRDMSADAAQGVLY